ncbi:hypothetical protein JXA34_03405 [Patescibacteria group bacterium]|nr:hypothetical protein [Patescibacteria group bacterium]
MKGRYILLGLGAIGLILGCLICSAVKPELWDAVLSRVYNPEQQVAPPEEPTEAPAATPTEPALAANPTEPAAEPTDPPSLAAESPLPTPSPTPTPEPTPEVSFDPRDHDGYWALYGDYPAYMDMRAAVREPGDEASFLVEVMQDEPRLTLLRLVPDDELIEAQFYPADAVQALDAGMYTRANATTVEWDLTEQLEMGYVTTETLTVAVEMMTATDAPNDDPARNLAYMASRGVDIIGGEILAQNYQAIHFDDVQAGSYFIFRVRDHEDKQVNRGILLVFSQDTDEYTLRLRTRPEFETDEAFTMAMDERPLVEIERPSIILDEEAIERALQTGSPW